MHNKKWLVSYVIIMFVGDIPVSRARLKGLK